MTVVPDTANVPAPRPAPGTLPRNATPVVMVSVRFPCAPDKTDRRLRHWQLGRARLICPGNPPPPAAGASDPFVTVIVVIPAADLGLPSEVIRRALRALPASPVYGLVREHLARVLRDAGEITRLGAGPMAGRATIELVRALVSSAGRDPDGIDTWDQALDTRLVAYIEQHLKDPGLRAEELARAHGISLRQLYKLWSSRHTTSLSEWIIRKRLEGARADLSRTGHGSATIATVAGRWGFANPAHFSRRFRDLYGMSPREWRLAPEGREL